MKMKDSKILQEKTVSLWKMIEADAVLLEWADELWLTLIDECVTLEDKTNFKFIDGDSITR